MKKFIITILLLLTSYPACFAEDLKLIMVDPKPLSDEVTYQNEIFSISFDLFQENGISVLIQNQSSKPIRIDWNYVSLVDTNGFTHKLDYVGTNWNDRYNPLFPTLIPPIPSSKIKMNFLAVVESTEPWKNFYSESDIDKSILVYAPLEIGGTLKPYIFTLKIVK
jgi:hypothetical protein